MKQINSISGQELREMFAAATGWLEKNSAEIDALNVFPVPDGDTGTNMLLTMRSTIEEAYRAPDHSASAVAHAMAGWHRACRKRNLSTRPTWPVLYRNRRQWRTKGSATR